MDKRIFLLIFLGALVIPSIALAQLVSYCGLPGQPECAGDIETLIEALVYWVWIIFGVIALVCFVVAGIMFLTSQGDPEKLRLARSAVIWGVVGIIVGIIAYSIIFIVQGALLSGTGGSGGNSIGGSCQAGQIWVDIGGQIPGGGYANASGCF